MVLDVLEAVAREHRAARLDEARGALDRDDAARGTHDFREVRRGEPGAGADVEDLRARPDAGAPPALENGRSPDLVLKSENELSAIPNFGRKSIEEVKETLRVRGLGLRDD